MSKLQSSDFEPLVRPSACGCGHTARMQVIDANRVELLIGGKHEQLLPRGKKLGEPHASRECEMPEFADGRGVVDHQVVVAVADAKHPRRGILSYDFAEDFAQAGSCGEAVDDSAVEAALYEREVPKGCSPQMSRRSPPSTMANVGHDPAQIGSSVLIQNLHQESVQVVLQRSFFSHEFGMGFYLMEPRPLKQRVEGHHDFVGRIACRQVRSLRKGLTGP